MDLPLRLEEETTVSGIDELKQTLIALFENEKRSFLQGASTGCVGVLHTLKSAVAIDQYALDVCSQVPGVKLIKTSATQKGEELQIEVSISYDKEELTLSYSEGQGWH